LVPADDLRALLQAARWAPSSYNEQPWRFIVARRENLEAFKTMLGCLSEENREWAAAAPVLMLTTAHTRFSKTGEENRHALHDVGLAMGNLTNQAIAMDLYVHQMAGIHPERARQVYDLPEDFEVVAGVALGFLGDPEDLEDDAHRRTETEARSRRPLAELVFAGSWGRTADFVAEE
jgi:nitroreductase